MIPNLLSLFRLLLIPVILFALIRGWKYPALGLIVLSAVTDLVDGWVARRFGQITDLGKILDPLGDKLSIGALGVYLAWAGKLPWWVVLIIVGKDLGIVIAGLSFWGTHRPVPVSDVWGKAAALAAGTLVVVAAMDWRKLLAPFIALALLSIAISIFSYSRTYLIHSHSLKEQQ